jgi:transposase
MVVLSAVGVRVREIGCLVQRSISTIRRWLVRSETTTELCDLPRSGRPPLYPEEERLRVVAFYCQTRPLPGCGRWSLQWAVAHLEANPDALGICPSKSTLHRMLQDNRLKPHRSRYFLHITDPNFFPKMEHLVELYKDPPRHLFFFDECPGIQVLNRLTPDIRTETTKQRLEEFEYIRGGTVDLFAFLRQDDGTVSIEVRADHKTETFLGVFRRHAQQLPVDEKIHYVMDNLDSHRSYPFCQLVAEFSGKTCPPEEQLSNREKRVEWLQRDDKRIVVHFTPFHGSWLNQVEIWFGIMGRKVLTESFRSPDDLVAALEAFAENWNQLWAHPFKWSYDGAELHVKAVERFTEMLRNSQDQLNLRTLTKLLRLMTNLLNERFSKIPVSCWARLVETLDAQSDAITSLVREDPGPQRKANARLAIAELNTMLQKREFNYQLAC